VDEGDFAYETFGEVRLDELLACVIVRLGLDLDSEIKYHSGLKAYLVAA
jgi:hypothetical protein